MEILDGEHDRLVGAQVFEQRKDLLEQATLGKLTPQGRGLGVVTGLGTTRGRERTKRRHEPSELGALSAIWSGSTDSETTVRNAAMIGA